LPLQIVDWLTLLQPLTMLHEFWRSSVGTLFF
jgi:hypothetical protein